MNWAASLVVAALVIGGGTERRHIVIVSPETACSATFDGRPLSIDEHGYPDASELKLDRRPVPIIGSRKVPDKCIGGVLYTLQANGFRTGRFWFDRQQ